MAKKSDPRIAALLAAYGSEPARWPEGERDRLDGLGSQERAAVTRDDKALDQLIANARDAADRKPASEDLMARIMNAAPAKSRSDGASVVTSVVAFETPRIVPRDTKSADEPTAGNAGGNAARPGLPPTISKRDLTAAAALLAASLVLGVFIGTTETGRSTAESMGTLAGISLTSQTAQLSAIDEALQASDDEDIL